MSQTFRQMFNLAGRKEPLANFLLLVGSVDAVIGSVGNYGTLLGLGLGLVGVAIALRWQSIQRRQAVVLEEPSAPIRYLPPAPPIVSPRQDR
ncbi:MAG: hypothetical protein KME15_17875 [Drouetiella hepatica Uher 2000/2452]|jgi:hypothetical protein|uniref:Uncharacterized protein n=1 Tax=Drouetiella hepatica Uher 2000/2452 TaxID=904376 RepID=A0A951QG19_9CYAN|nr:hypothetical protein [Drouetiella hepatica Uher 2000/2452]